jgi:2-oxoisovalerate dehydrogenase E1 component
VIFGISNNDRCISLPGHGWLAEFVRTSGVRAFTADGTNLPAVHERSAEAFAFSRGTHRPAILVFDGLPRRFGHAATDRQTAYMTPEEIQAQTDKDPLAGGSTSPFNGYYCII